MNEQRPLFFIHVMKTAGTNLKFRFHQSFEVTEVFPNQIDDKDSLVEANTLIEYMTGLSAERKARTKAFGGHFPYIAAEMLGVPCTTLTVLRDPVDRVVSHLRQVRRNKQGWQRFAEELIGVEDPTFEQLYDDPFLRPRFFVDHQVRIFSLGLADDPKTYVDLFEVDEGRLEAAKTNLAKVDVVGLTSEYEEFDRILGERFGLATEEMPNLQAAPENDLHVPADLRERIAADNALDAAFYDFAVDLVEARRRGTT
jgi:hypothetical protein